MTYNYDIKMMIYYEYDRYYDVTYYEYEGLYKSPL